MDLTTWMTFVAATVALLVIPGPKVVLVLAYALTQGRRVALASAGGVALGDFIAMTTFLLGLGAIVLASATAFTVLKWIGALYLVWMGIGMIRSTGTATAISIEDAPQLSGMAVFSNATVVTALNPKEIVFFIAFVPQFIRTDASLAPQFAVLIATFVGLAALNALLADRLRATIRRPGLQAWMTWIGGSVLIGMGVLTATLCRAA
jgi:threonine/homoserine/homoserine lactone efflux protein